MFDCKFYLFLYPQLIKQGINNKYEAYNHWIKYGQNENRIAFHKDRDKFNWKIYLKTNKFLIKNGIIDKRQAILHWYNIGKKQGLLLNNKKYKSHKKLIKKSQIINIEFNKIKKYSSKNYLNKNKKHNNININNNFKNIIIHDNYDLKKQININKNYKNIKNTSFTKKLININKQICINIIKNNSNNCSAIINNSKTYNSNNFSAIINNSKTYNSNNCSDKNSNIYSIKKKTDNLNLTNNTNINSNNITDNKTNYINTSIKKNILLINKNLSKIKYNKVINNILKNNNLFNIKVKNNLYTSSVLNLNLLLYFHNITDKNQILILILYYHQFKNFVTLSFDILSPFIIKIINIIKINVLKFNKNFVKNYTFFGFFSKIIFINKSFFKIKTPNNIFIINHNLKDNYIIPNELIYKKNITYALYSIIKIKNISINFYNLKIFNYNFYHKYINYVNSSFNIIKTEQYIYKYIDHIYVLNLKRQKKKFNKIINNLNKVGIYTFEKFYGIDGNDNNLVKYLYKLYYNTSFTKFDKYLNRKSIPSVGSFSILISMYFLIKKAINFKYKNILILQDDIILDKNFINKFNKTISNLPNWYLLYLGANDKSFQSIYYYCCGKTDGAFAIIINYQIFNDILNEISKILMPFDSGALIFIQKKYYNKSLVIYPNLIIADVTSSECRKKRDQVKFSNKVLWNLNNFNFETDNIIQNINKTIIICDFNKLNLQTIINIIKHKLNCYFIIISENIVNSYILNNIRIYKIQNSINIKDLYMAAMYSYTENIIFTKNLDNTTFPALIKLKYNKNIKKIWNCLIERYDILSKLNLNIYKDEY